MKKISLEGINGRMPLLVQIVKHFPDTKPLKIAFLGYSDLVHSPEEWKKIVGDKITELENRPNHQKLCQIHGMPNSSIIPFIGDALHVAYEGRVTGDVFDFQKYEGTEILHDFNTPLPKKYEAKYDIVLDYGSLEHIFNVPQAIINLAKMCKAGGIVVHQNPLVMLNHGFYSLNPCFYFDFYYENGFDIISSRLSADGAVQTENGQNKKIKFHIDWNHNNPDMRFKLWDIERQTKINNLSKMEFGIEIIARKIQEKEKINFPIQGRYRNADAWK